MTSAPFTPPSAASSPSSRDWAALGGDPSPASGSAAASVAVTQTNVGGAATAARSGGVLHGESVIVLLDSLSSAPLCCAPIGTSGRSVCFKSACDCSVASHSKARTSEVLNVFAPGIYVRASGTDTVYRAPVGDVSLLENHQSAILDTVQPEVSAWPILFNNWARTSDSGEAKKNRVDAEAARAVQTPAAPHKSRPASINYTTIEVDTPDETEVEAGGLAMYETVWSSAAETASLPLPSAFTMGQVVLDTTVSLQHLNSTVLQMGNDVINDRTWSDSNARSTAQRVTDLEVSVGLPTANWTYGSTVWSSLAGLASTVETACGDSIAASLDINNLDREFQAMFTSISAFKSTMSDKVAAMSNRVDFVESQSLASMSTPEIARLVESVESMSNRVSMLEKERIRDRIEIEALQTRLETGTARFELAPGVVLRSPRDVRLYLEKIGAVNVGFGGFADVYNVLARCNMMIEASPSFAEAVKSQKDVSGTNMSHDEALVNYSFQSSVPGIFSGKKTDKTSIPSLPSAAKWKNDKGINSGMGYELEEHVETARNTIEEVISLLYDDHDRLQSLCNAIVGKASDFLLQFIRWVDDTNTTLVGAGNAPADVWALITKVMRSIFEEGLAPHRITPVASKFKDPLEKMSVMIWGVIRSHMATKAILKKGFKDHPVVVGAYAQWLVSNSGKKDASEAKAAIAKVTATVADLKDSFATKKALSSLESRIETVKKVADKAASASKSN